MTQYASVKTEIPGPKSREWLARKEGAVVRAWDPHAPVMIAKGKGALIEDIDGNAFIDFTGGIGALNVGHTPPEVVEALKTQIDSFLHTDFTIAPYTSLIELAERLCDAAPGTFEKRAVFFNSGAEAVENAVKIAKYASGKHAVIAFEGAFHGRTLMAMSLTSKIKPYKKHFHPFAPEVYRMPYAYCYRCYHGLTYPSCDLHCAKTLERAFVTTVDPDNVACVVIEPVQGEGGFVVPPKEYLPMIQEICRRYGIYLIVDEVQTGFARTGALFASERFGIEPDVITVAKSLGAGIPISGVIGREEIMNVPEDSTIGGTYVGNPLGCVAGLKVLEIIEKQNLCARACQQGDLMMKRFTDMMDRYPLIGDVRGLGAMVGVELVRDRATKEAAGEECSAVLKEAMRRGVIALKAGTYGNVLRMLATLAITDEQLEEGLDLLEESLREVSTM